MVVELEIDSSLGGWENDLLHIRRERDLINFSNILSIIQSNDFLRSQ